MKKLLLIICIATSWSNAEVSKQTQTKTKKAQAVAPVISKGLLLSILGFSGLGGTLIYFLCKHRSIPSGGLQLTPPNIPLQTTIVPTATDATTIIASESDKSFQTKPAIKLCLKLGYSILPINIRLFAGIPYDFVMEKLFNKGASFQGKSFKETFKLLACNWHSRIRDWTATEEILLIASVKYTFDLSKCIYNRWKQTRAPSAPVT